jgi:uncharacterized protein YpmS
VKWTYYFIIGIQQRKFRISEVNWMTNEAVLKKHKKTIIISGILLLFIAAIIIFLNLLLYRNDTLSVRVSPVTSSISKIIAAEKTGGSVELKAEDINGIIQFYLKDQKDFGPVTITNIYTELKDGKITLYIPARYGKLNLFLSAKGTVNLEKGNILFAPDSFSIGKLSLPKDFVMNKIKSYAKSINISDGKIVINKSILYFDIASITIMKDSMVIFVNKQQKAPRQTVGAGTSSTTSGNTAIKIQAQATHDLLLRAKSQLDGVRSSASSAAEKSIVSNMQLVIGKMVSDPSYSYQAEAATVKSDYNKLSSGDKDDLKNAILYNMEMDTLEKLKSTFGM